MSTEMLNVEFKGINKGKPKLKSDGFVLPFYQNKKSLRDLEYHNKFIKACEKLIRTSKEYKAYKKYLIKDVGLNYCQVFPNINLDNCDESEITLEMHHGPILTLYDYCNIVTEHLLYNDYKEINTFKIASIVLNEHFENNVQVVMLCDLAHKLVHAKQVYLNPKQGWGNVNTFLDKYKDGIDDKMEHIINKNIEIAQKYHSFDRDKILEIAKIERWDISNIEDYI